MNKLPCQVLIITLLILTAGTVRAQSVSKVEVGPQVTNLTLFPPSGFGDITEPGFGGRFTFNFNDKIALDAEGNFFPNKNVFLGVGEGRAVQGQFGVKVGKRFKKFGLFAKVRPGFLSIGDVFSFRPGSSAVSFGFTIPNARIGRETHFTTDVGGVLEFYPSKRTIVRFDGGDTIIRYGPHFEPNPINFNVLDKFPSRVKHNLQITAGVGFRLGMTQTSQPASGSDQSDLQRYEVGIHFTSMSMNPPTPRCPDICFLSEDRGPVTEPGLGGRFTYNLTRNIGIEAEMNFFTRNHESFNSNPTGHIYQGQFGGKIGKRFDRFGLFGKVRPGFVGFTKVIRLVGTRNILFGDVPFTIGDFRTAHKEYFSNDLGGVLEFYVSPRLMTRMDFGDTIIHYSEFQTMSFSLSQNILRRPPETRHNFQFNAGIGFRF
jgi:hypothetical protein